MKGIYNLTNKEKPYDSNNINIFYNSNRINNEVYFNIPYDENTFYDDYNIPNAFNDNFDPNDRTNNFYNKIEKKLLQNENYNSDLEDNQCNNTNISVTSLMVNYFFLKEK
jgi:hypothetical protein